MSGLELFMDGGATVAGLLSAGAAMLGYQQQKEDDSELACSEEEFSLLRKNLAEAYTSLCAAHSAITSAWGQPLSLFKRAARDAEVALEVVEGAKRLVERAAALEDLADVYDAQLQLATGAGAGAGATRCVRRGPVQALEAELEELSLKLSGRIAALVRAKEALETNQPLAEVEAGRKLL
ncbi:unnamed protein product [Effrenium voratum]|nr:unnamed protein product [Effrenium voratum]